MTENKLKTLIVFVQDETASMQTIKDQTIDAFNEYFDTLKKEKGLGKVKVQAYQFSDIHGAGYFGEEGEDRVRLLHDGKLKEVPTADETNYRPRGNTPLFDAIGTAVSNAEKEKADRYLLVVQTDGYENASKEFTRETITKLIKEKEKSDNWTLVFLGAGLEDWTREVVAFGAAAGSSASYKPNQTRQVYASLATTTSSMLQTDSLANKNLASETEEELKKKETV